MRDALSQPATPEVVAAFAANRGISAADAAAHLTKLRDRQIAARGNDPFNCGYEPPIWYVVNALMRSAPISEQQRAFVKKRFDMDWPTFAERIRLGLGFKHPVGEILIMGANRAGKTDFAAKWVMKGCWQGNQEVNIGFQSLPTGKQVQMPRVWYYMPNPWKEKNIAGRKSDDINEHISYTKQNGFSSSKITFGNQSSVRFISYAADVTTNMEGSAIDKCWLDEEFMKTFLDAARFRLASKRGTLLCTFTPVHGYTPVVANFLSDMVVTSWHTAWMLPLDGGAPMPWKELGLEEGEYRKLITWRNQNPEGDPGVPESRPENILERILDGRAGDDSDGVPPGRTFARSPRIGICRGGEAAAVWFYGRDNPYGMPGEVIAKAMKNQNAAKEIKCRVYGIAEQIKGRMFPEFRREKNVCRAEDLPEKLVRIQVVDPAPERNWTFCYYGYDPVTDILYKYREWPGSYEIPGVGYPGPWAVVSDRKMGVNDGDKGDAQEPFGFGFLSYKFEWARLEGWRNYSEWVASGHLAAERCQDWDVLEEWSEVDGVVEHMQFRVIDARASSQSKIHMSENVSLFDDVAKLADGFVPASGQKIDIGINLLRDRIANGRYKIVDTCTNSIFAMETYCGADGQKGACKDFIDCDRYCVLSGIADFTAENSVKIGEMPSEPTHQGAYAANQSSTFGGAKSHVWW